ncbi:hypothetical protein N7507_007252 [Penicillium longicatenatum]|nr:hypothetical protein N7507_007252 [Penicillium longicatenatum]
MTLLEVDPDKKVQSGLASPGSPAERRSTFSLPFVFKTPTRRLSIIDPPDLSPTCAERGHYPVFNPLDPRHNPSATSSWRRQESQTSSSDSQKQSHWVQDFPRRSLHKARSGLLALRAGLLRRHRPSMSMEITPARRPEASSASTQEDLSFGVALYRTNVPWPPTEDEPSIDVLMRAAAFHPLANIASAPEVREFPVWGFHDPDAVFSHDVSMAFHQPASKASCDGILDCQNSHSHEVKANKDDQETGDMEQKATLIRDAHPLASTDWETIESSSTSSTGGQVESSRKVDSAQAAHLQEQITALHSTRRIPTNGDISMSHEEIGSDNGYLDSPSLNQQILDNRRGSFMRRSSGVLSTISSNTSHRRRMSWMQSEAFVTQDRLLLFDQGPPSSAAGTCSTTSLGQSSADVPVAFPGIYQALLEQWIGDRDRNRSSENIVGIFTCGLEDLITNGTQAPITIPSPTVNFLLDTPHQIYEEAMLFDPLSSSPHPVESIFPESDPRNDLAFEDEELNPTDDAFTFNSNIDTQPSSGPITHPEERRHSFGLHISMINVGISFTITSLDD